MEESGELNHRNARGNFSGIVYDRSDPLAGALSNFVPRLIAGLLLRPPTAACLRRKQTE
jgi:hypothetical protein